MPFGALVPIAGAVLGGMIGAQGNKGRQTQSTSVNLRSIEDLNQGRSALESSAVKGQEDLYSQLQGLIGLGPGQAEVQAGMASQSGFADALQAALAQGGLPTGAQTGQAQQYAQAIFQPQQVALNQQFEQQRIMNQRLAARMGRAGTDPVLQAKLAQSQGQQQAILGAQQGAFAAETAMNLPQLQLHLANQLANVRGGLASQALQNRASLLSMGQQLAQSERDYRLRAAGQTTTGTTSSGGGMAGMLSGALAGAGGAMLAFDGFDGTGGAAAASVPQSGPGQYIKPF